MLALTPSVQSPRAYDLSQLTAAQLGTRLAAGANAALRGNVRDAIQDRGYRFKIHPAETAAGLVDAGLRFGIDPFCVDRYFDNANPGTTNATAGILAAIDAAPAGGRVVFGPGPYLIDADAIVFDHKLDTHFENTVFYCPAGANEIALQWGLSNAGWFNTHHTGRFELFRASAGGTLLPVMNGTQTAASQLLGTGVKYLNLARANFALSTYVFGFKYGHHWESAGSIGMTLCRFEFLEGQNNLVDFLFKPVSDGSNTNYVTRLSIGDFMTTFNATHYSSVVGTRFIEVDKNGESVDGLTFQAGTLQNVKEYKLTSNASECVWRDIYWDLSTATEDDIWFKSGSSMNVVENGAGQRLQSVLDEGTLNNFVHPFNCAHRPPAGQGDIWHTYNGGAEIPARRRTIGITLDDDEPFDSMPAGGSGIVLVGCGAEGGIWHVAADRTCTKLAGTTNTGAGGSDGQLSVYNAGSDVRVINRLGSQQKCVIEFLHWV